MIACKTTIVSENSSSSLKAVQESLRINYPPCECADFAFCFVGHFACRAEVLLTEAGRSPLSLRLNHFVITLFCLFPAVRSSRKGRKDRQAVTMQLDAPFPLTPALSPRRGRTFGSATKRPRLLR